MMQPPKFHQMHNQVVLRVKIREHEQLQNLTIELQSTESSTMKSLQVIHMPRYDDPKAKVYVRKRLQHQFFCALLLKLVRGMQQR